MARVRCRAADVACGGDGADTISSGPDGMLAYGDAGHDDLVVGEGTIIDLSSLYGGDGDDVLTNLGLSQVLADGGTGNDTFVGGPGNEYFTADSGDDVIDGGGGVNIHHLCRGPRPRRGQSEAGRLVGYGHDTIANVGLVTGSRVGDVLIGDDNDNEFNSGIVDDTGMDYVAGLGGSDTFFGSGTLLGGDGDDTFASTCCFSTTNDKIAGGSGLDVLDYTYASAPVTVDLAAGTASGRGLGTDSVAGIENVLGTPGADTITGGDAANQLKGSGGNDRISGNGGGDALYGGFGNDYLDGGSDVDSLYGGDGQDTCTTGEVTSSCES